MAKIYSFDGSNIRCTNSETCEWDENLRFSTIFRINLKINQFLN